MYWYYRKTKAYQETLIHIIRAMYKHKKYSDKENIYRHRTLSSRRWTTPGKGAPRHLARIIGAMIRDHKMSVKDKVDKPQNIL